MTAQKRSIQIQNHSLRPIFWIVFCTLSACLRQSILLIFPFWSGFERQHIAGFFPLKGVNKMSVLNKMSKTFMNNWSEIWKMTTPSPLPVIDNTKSSRHSWAMSFRSFPSNLLAHFCLTSAFSDWKRKKWF